MGNRDSKSQWPKEKGNLFLLSIKVQRHSVLLLAGAPAPRGPQRLSLFYLIALFVWAQFPKPPHGPRSQLSSSHHVCIPASKKKKGMKRKGESTWQITSIEISGSYHGEFCLYLIGQNQSLAAKHSGKCSLYSGWQWTQLKLLLWMKSSGCWGASRNSSISRECMDGFCWSILKASSGLLWKTSGYYVLLCTSTLVFSYVKTLPGISKESQALWSPSMGSHGFLI